MSALQYNIPVQRPLLIIRSKRGVQYSNTWKWKESLKSRTIQTVRWISFAFKKASCGLTPLSCNVNPHDTISTGLLETPTRIPLLS